MERPKIRPATALTFLTDLHKTSIQERYQGYDPTGKIWLMWNDGKAVYVGRAFFGTFCVLPE